MTIVSAYRVCKNSLAGAGEGSVWMQEYNEYLKDGTIDPDPRSQVLVDLKESILTWKEAGHSVILLIDANESLYDKLENQFKNLMAETDMHDGLHHLHPDLPEVPTRQPGSKQIDYICVTSDLLPFLRKGGILPIHFIHPSDHRTLYIDLDITKALRTDLTDLINPHYRTLRLTNVKAINKFISILKEYYKNHNILNRLLEIEQGLRQANNQETIDFWIKKAQALDRQRTCFKLAAEKKCAKSKLNPSYPWSLKLAQAGQKITYWKGRKESALFDIPLRPYLYKLKETLKIQDTGSQNPQYIKKHLAQAWKDKKTLHSHTAELRKEFLDELAAYHAEKKRIKQSSMVKQLKNAEGSRNEHRKINWYFKPEKRGSINTILVPKGHTQNIDPEWDFEKFKEWDEITDAEEIFRVVLAYNEKHLKSSITSPFAQSPLFEHLGRYGDGPKVDEILAGTYVLGTQLLKRPDARELSVFMKAITHPNTQTNPNKHVPLLQSYIKQEKFERLFRETPERTSSSPSGLHIGQYKAIFSDQELAAIETLAINIPFQYGFSYERWQNSTHIMLKKEALPYIHRLRIIQLFEADFNAALKILYSHRMMPHGDKTNFSGEQAQGARKGRTPQDLIINLQYTAINSEVT